MKFVPFTVTPGHMAACPKCGNETRFRAVSDRCAEDCYELWVQCWCGHEPPEMDRREDVWGEINQAILSALAHDWNDWVRQSGKFTAQHTSEEI